MLAKPSLGPWGSKDPSFSKPFIDVDEWREQPVRHRYVHGGFEGTDTRFLLLLPPRRALRRPLLPSDDCLGGSLTRYVSRTSHRFAEPGTYFPAVRITTQRQGDVSTRHGRIQNLGRVRVVVR